ncbi:hypothetical protein BpHYR1_019030 [Brachionus plicatilis]|uniref:Uncharacterized protein n=1 Tax=Brachionus plicatilis TaxID=10195 RepID=A0A3M7SFG8_BRAPC|nr:hypothetical protein BpHYR1_019030 [Brachionus plicatilis]
MSCQWKILMNEYKKINHFDVNLFESSICRSLLLNLVFPFKLLVNLLLLNVLGFLKELIKNQERLFEYKKKSFLNIKKQSNGGIGEIISLADKGFFFGEVDLSIFKMKTSIPPLLRLPTLTKIII